MAGKLLMFSDAQTDCVFNNIIQKNQFIISINRVGAYHMCDYVQAMLMLIGN